MRPPTATKDDDELAMTCFKKNETLGVQENEREGTMSMHGVGEHHARTALAHCTPNNLGHDSSIRSPDS